MSTKLFRIVLLGMTFSAMLMMAVVAYGRYRTEGKETEDCCMRLEPSPNTELPWEELATQWFRAVSL